MVHTRFIDVRGMFSIFHVHFKIRFVIKVITISKAKDKDKDSFSFIETYTRWLKII